MAQNTKDNSAGYKIGPIIDSSEVPNWARRQPKWHDLIEKINSLSPGQSLMVTFEDAKVAKCARNTVRDTINLRLERAAVRTRMVKDAETGETKLYFTRLHDKDIIEEERNHPE
jgi:hypothetical protein